MSRIPPFRTHDEVDIDIEDEFADAVDVGILDDIPGDSDYLLTVSVLPEAGGERLDKFLAGGDTGLSRTRIKQLMLEGAVRVDGNSCGDPSRKVRAGSMIEIAIPAPEDDTPEAEDIPLSILYEDGDL